MTQAIAAPGFPLDRGAQLTKEVAYLNMREAAAAAQLDKLWSDTFLTNAGINSGTSTGYTYRGASNYDVILDASQPNAHSGMTSPVLPLPLVATEDAGVAHKSWEMYDDDTTTTYWQATGALPHWSILDLGSAKTVASVNIKTYDGSNYPTAYKVEGSNTGAFGGEQTLLLNLSGQTDTGTFTKNFTTTGSFRYYKVTFTAGVGTTEVLLFNFRYKLAAASQAVITSVLITMPSAVTSAMVFADVTGGPADLYEISSDNGSTWQTIDSADIGKIISIPSGTQILLRVTISGSMELESWGVACA